LLAALTGLSLYGVAQQNTPAQQAANVRTVDVIVAKADMPNRTVITAALLAHRSFPSDLVPAGVITNEADAVGQSTIAPIARGQVLVFSQLNSVEAARSASTTIEKGKVLVAFPTTDPLTTAGLVNVGDHVDLLASVLAGTGADAKVSQTTLQDLQVVDVLAPTKEQPGRVTSLVFAVDHQVALVLKYLRDAQATVDLAIRSRLETDLVKTTGVDLKYVVQTYGFQR
jgi:Flp pilus assembly protein CpaB